MSRMGKIKAAKPSTKVDAAIATANNGLGKLRVLAWANAAQPGEMLCYATGERLAGKGETYSPAVWAMRSLYNDGVVTLIQKRLTHYKRKHGAKAAVEGTFAWIAVKLAERRQPESAYSIDGQRVDRFIMRDEPA